MKSGVHYFNDSYSLSQAADVDGDGLVTIQDFRYMLENAKCKHSFKLI